jgi:hypothetical protein
MTRYITLAQAQAMRPRATSFFDPRYPGVGVVGVRHGDDYYVVPDDDPRLANQAPDPAAGA